MQLKRDRYDTGLDMKHGQIKISKKSTMERVDLPGFSPGAFAIPPYLN
jgi:hypothetical protein